MSVFDYLDQEAGAPPAPRMADLWEWARDDYLAGEAADVVCERHRLSRSQFFERARREGWLRRDRPRSASEPAYDAQAEAAFVEDALDRPAPSAYALYRRAWARAERAIAMNRRVEAQGWTRLARDLRKLACEEAGGRPWPTVSATAEAAAPDPAPHFAPDSGDSRPSGEPAQRPSPSPDLARHPAPAAEDAEGQGLAARRGPRAEPDSPDSLQAPSGAPPAARLNRRERRRRAKLAGAAPAEKARPGFRGADAMG